MKYCIHTLLECMHRQTDTQSENIIPPVANSVRGTMTRNEYKYVCFHLTIAKDIKTLKTTEPKTPFTITHSDLGIPTSRMGLLLEHWGKMVDLLLVNLLVFVEEKTRTCLNHRAMSICASSWPIHNWSDTDIHVLTWYYGPYCVIQVMWCRYWSGVGLVIYRSWVRVLAGHHCIMAYLHLCAFVTKQYNLVLAKGGDLFDRKSNRRPDAK